jgi:hypothetical protein
VTADAFQTTCVAGARCSVVLAGTTPAVAAETWFRAALANPGAATRNVMLTVGPATGAAVRTFSLTGAVATGLRNQTDRFQLTLGADAVVETTAP